MGLPTQIKAFVKRAISRFRAALRDAFRKWIVRQDVWFDSDISRVQADIAFVKHLRFKPPFPAVPEKTILIDLLADEEKLWSEIDKDTRYEIKRALRDGVVTAVSPQDSGVVDQFCDAYRELELRKGLPPHDRGQLMLLHAAGRLIVTTSSHASSPQPLSWHAYVASGTRVRLLHSVSRLTDAEGPAARAFVGRANRAHHWNDFLHFKFRGFEFYDFGGWYGADDGDDTARRSIGEFKKGFGGEIVGCYSAAVPLTWRGRLALFLHAAMAHRART